METTHLFIRLNSVSESLESTQLMTHNGFTRIDSNKLTTQNGFMKFDSNRLMSQKASRILIQINSQLRKLFRILIPINSWLNDAIHSQFRVTHFVHSTLLMTWYDLFGLSTQVLTSSDLFGAFDSSSFPTNWSESAHDSGSISVTWND